jgi:catechol 2,3-dioxygenase-like lactoylglutathione lyase family enzyme
MKRFHVNLSVEDLAASIRFYTDLFATEPTIRKDDYARWMLEDPRINFAISRRGHSIGVNHLGFQVDSADELTAMRAQLIRADHAVVEQIAATCCYAKSDKYWVTDPAGIPWESFHTLDSIPIYGVDMSPKSDACCVPLSAITDGRCCTPAPSSTSGCCA